MIHTTTSIREVIARIVRNTRLQDSSFLVDMNEWIPEAMGYMKTRYTLQPFWQDVRTRYHRARLPCGLVSKSAVQYNGHRLRYYNGGIAAGGFQSPDGRSAAVYPGIPEQGTTLFGTHLVKREAVDDGVDVSFYETDLRKVNSLPFSGDAWYFDEPDYITTSFENGVVRIHGKRLPVDAEGYPLIPDDELYKEALYYYVRAKMIGAGYEDKQFREDVLMQRFQDYAEKAIARITYPTVDEMDSRVDRMTRLIMPDDMWDSFFNAGPEPIYGMSNGPVLDF